MRNITVRQYSGLADTSEYEVLENLKPNNSFRNRVMNVNAMPYSNVKYAIRLLSKISDWSMVQQLFSICFDVPEHKFWSATVTEYFSARRYLIQTLEQCIVNENKVMASANQDSHLWKMAGADRLRSFGDTLPLIHLSKMFGMFPYDIGRKPYSEVLSLMVATKTQQEVENEYFKLKQNTKP